MKSLLGLTLSNFIFAPLNHPRIAVLFFHLFCNTPFFPGPFLTHLQDILIYVKPILVLFTLSREKFQQTRGTESSHFTNLFLLLYFSVGFVSLAVSAVYRDVRNLSSWRTRIPTLYLRHCNCLEVQMQS